MSHGYTRDRLSSLNKRKLIVIALAVGIVLLVILITIGAIAVAIISAVLGQADTGIGQSIGKAIQAVWGYIVDFINALLKQAITNPLQFLTGDNN